MLTVAPLLAAAAGATAAVLHVAGALKSTPAGAALPFDLTLAALLMLVALLPALVAARRWWLAPSLGLPLAACGLLWLWWVLAAAGSPWEAGVADRLPEIVLLGPLMLLAGLVVGADDAARRAFGLALILAGIATAAGIAWGLAADSLVLGGEPGSDPSRVRVAYQVAGLAIACAAGLVALRAVAARGTAARLLWLGLLAALAGAVLLPGGRAAFVALALVVAVAPALLLARMGRGAAAATWLLLLPALAAVGLGILLADPDRAAQLATVERLLRGTGDLPSAREVLWAEAWRLGDGWGLGPGGYPPAAGFGQDRGMHPHNHAVEALVEGGVLGLALWGGAFGGGALLVLARIGRVAPARAAEVVALTLPLAVTAMVSTDLGNRMAWLALGLALSLAVEARDA